jgi:hypothetical protein
MWLRVSAFTRELLLCQIRQTSIHEACGWQCQASKHHPAHFNTNTLLLLLHACAVRCCCRFADAPYDRAEDGAAGVVDLVDFMPNDDGEEHQAEQGSDSSSMSSDDDSSLEEGGDAMEADEGDDNVYALQQQQQQPGAAAEGGAVEEVQQQGLVQAATAGQPAGSSTADGAAGSAAAAAPAPRAVVSSASTSSIAPELPVAATEVAAALGWLPTGDHAGMLAVQLQQPRSANLVCALLLDCEDVRPGFNSSRGGCNIDMQLVMLRGFAVGQVPLGLQVGLPGE